VQQAFVPQDNPGKGDFNCAKGGSTKGYAEDAPTDEAYTSISCSQDASPYTDEISQITASHDDPQQPGTTTLDNEAEDKFTHTDNTCESTKWPSVAAGAVENSVHYAVDTEIANVVNTISQADYNSNCYGAIQGGSHLNLPLLHKQQLDIRQRQIDEFDAFMRQFE
jgi:hypothetical protein